MRPAPLLLLSGALAIAAMASAAATRDPLPVKTDPALLEQSPVASSGYLAWAQSRPARLHFDVFAQAQNGRPFRVNARGTQGRPGGISGRTLVYQEWRGRRSNIRLFDLVRHKRSNPPPGVNTSQWESRPSLSGTWLLFNRRNPTTKLELVLLRNLRSRRQIVLARTRSPLHLSVQQLAGNYAVWTRCRLGKCALVGYNRATGRRFAPAVSGIPEASDYAASVLVDGTIYFVRGQMFCDPGSSGAFLIRYKQETGSQRIMDFNGGTPVALNATTEGGIPVVYFDRGPCRAEDIYRTFDSPPQLP